MRVRLCGSSDGMRWPDATTPRAVHDSVSKCAVQRFQAHCTVNGTCEPPISAYKGASRGRRASPSAAFPVTSFQSTTNIRTMDKGDGDDSKTVQGSSSSRVPQSTAGAAGALHGYQSNPRLTTAAELLYRTARSAQCPNRYTTRGHFPRSSSGKINVGKCSLRSESSSRMTRSRFVVAKIPPVFKSNKSL